MSDDIIKKDAEEATKRPPQSERPIGKWEQIFAARKKQGEEREACTEKEQLASRQLASEQMADAAGYAADDVASSSAK